MSTRIPLVREVTRRSFLSLFPAGFLSATIFFQKRLLGLGFPQYWVDLALPIPLYGPLLDTQVSRSTPPSGVSIKRFKTPGKQYVGAAKTFRQELYSHYEKKKPYSIGRIFSLFPFQVDDKKKKQSLIDRGDIDFEGTKVFNRGMKLEVQFFDEFLKKIIVVFPQLLQAQMEILPEGALRLEFDPEHTGLVVLYMVDPKHEIAPNQLLESITFSKDNISYLLHQEGKDNQKIRIIVDLTTAAPSGTQEQVPKS